MPALAGDTEAVSPPAAAAWAATANPGASARKITSHQNKISTHRRIRYQIVIMKFRVRVGDADLPVEFTFATQDDLARLAGWRSPKKLRDNPHVQDALEYCQLANKRWKTYRAIGRTAVSLGEVGHAIQKDASTEVVFVMLARAEWHKPSPILGFCFCRRTWCHHVVLDFAASHPNAIGPAGGEVQGVGAGMLYSLVQMAGGIGVKTIWGEATRNSTKFYEKTLAVRNVADHFFIRGRTRQHCLRQFELVAWR